MAFNIIGALIWIAISGYVLRIFVPMLFKSLHDREASIQFLQTFDKPSRTVRVVNWFQLALMVALFGWIGMKGIETLIRAVQ